MKFIICLIIFTSMNAFSFECAKELINEDVDVKDIENSGVKFNHKRVEVWNKYYGLEGLDRLDQHCIDIMSVVAYQGKSGKVYVEMHTNEDECDGGNIYGLILDINDEVVVEIGDSSLYCPKN